MRAMLLALAAACAGSQDVGILRSGPIPKSLTAPSRVTWIAQDAQEPPVECSFPQPSAWACQPLSPHARGVVVIVDAQQGVAAIPVGLATADSAPVASKWGRAVRLTPGGVPQEDLHDVKVSAWRPLRPASRLLTQRFSTAEEPGITVLRLSDEMFWIAGNAVDTDAYLRIDGPALASSRLAVAGLQDGQPEFPVFADVSPPVSIRGQVVDEHGQSVEDAVVELWAPLRPGEGPKEEKDAGKALLRWAAVRTDTQGRFDFPRIAPGPYEIEAIHGSAGRGAATVSSLAEPVLLKLEAPAVATGRILRHGLAVGAARVRFVPDATAFSESTDPAVHVSDEASSDTEGRFLLPLPPVRRGAVQVNAPDGSVVRVPFPATPGSSSVSLGDIPLPDKRTVILRLMDPRACEVTAAGPLGQIGLAMVRATRESAGIFLLQVPEAGTWVLEVQCGDRSYDVEPPAVVVPADGPDMAIDIRLADSLQ